MKERDNLLQQLKAVREGARGTASGSYAYDEAFLVQEGLLGELLDLGNQELLASQARLETAHERLEAATTRLTRVTRRLTWATWVLLVATVALFISTLRDCGGH